MADDDSLLRGRITAQQLRAAAPDGIAKAQAIRALRANPRCHRPWRHHRSSLSPSEGTVNDKSFLLPILHHLS